MACVSKFGPAQHTLSTLTTTLSYTWYTGWVPCVGMDTVKAVIRVRNVVGNFQAQPAFQVASVRTDMPDAPVAVGSPMGAGESCTGEANVSTDTDDKMFIRFGVAHGLSSGSALGSADVEFEVGSVACGRIVGTSTQTLVTTSTSSVVYPIGGFLPALEVAKWKLGAVISGLTGNAQWRLCWRSATTSMEVPNAWTTTESYRSTSNTVVNTGEVATAITNDMYVQPGIELSLSSGSTPAQLTITTTLGARRA